MSLQYKIDRRDALSTMDERLLLTFAKNYGVSFLLIAHRQGGEQFLIAAHRMRVSLREMQVSKRLASKAFLDERGVKYWNAEDLEG